MISGIYKIINIINQKLYIGSSKDVLYRKYEHFRDLKLKQHHSTTLQNAFNKYGEQNFTFEILEECEKENLIEREQYYFDTLKPEYNICQIAGNTLGVKHNEVSKQKMSEFRKGKSFHSDFQRKRISEVHTNKIVSKETRELRARAVEQINPFTNEVVAEYYSLSEATRLTKINNIFAVLKGIQQSSGNYKWRYKIETEEDRNRVDKERKILKRKRKPQYICHNNQKD